MPQTYVNFAGVERVDLIDMLQVAQRTPADAQQELLANICLPQRSFSIVSGFQPYAKDANTVGVGIAGVRNVAILGTREGGTIRYAVLSASGPDAQNISISSYPSGSFGIYVRATLQPGTSQQRIFWDDAQLQEVAQLTPTQLLMSWEVLVQAAVPSGEWYKLGTANVTAQGAGAGSTVAVVDARRLMFEGVAGQSSLATWGSAQDRTTDRGGNPITSLQTKLDALTTCITDIKGQGLVNWYEPYIGGLNIGRRFAATDVPSLERVAIGDVGFNLQGGTGFSIISFNGSSAQLVVSRISNRASLFLGNGLAAMWSADGYSALGRVPNLVVPVQPLTVWNYAPYGRVAQFSNTDGVTAGAISIGTTGNAGAQIDFARPSITDFQASIWSIRGDFQAQPTFSILGPNGTVLTSQMFGTSGNYTTTLYGNVTNLNGNTLNLNAGPGFIQANNALYANFGFYHRQRFVDSGNVVWCGVNYVEGSPNVTTIGQPNLFANGTISDDGTWVGDFNSPLPNNAIVLISVPRRNGSIMLASHEIQNNRYRLLIDCRAINGDRSRFSFNVLILYGSN